MKPNFLFLSYLFLTFSCGRPECVNNNAVFNQFKPESREYKAELATQINVTGKENLRFWISRMGRKNGIDFLELYVQGPDLCARMFAENQSGRLTGKKNGDYSGGFGYHSAGVKGIEFRTVFDSSGTRFIVEKIGRIID